MLVSLQYGGISRQSKQKINQNNQKSVVANQSNVNFGRALTPEERMISNILVERAFQINGVDTRAVIMPGASTAPYTMNHNGKKIKVDTGVGSPNSKAAVDQLLLFKDIHGINARQSLPTGTLTPENSKYADKSILNETFENVCPFSGSPLEKGSQNIDPGSLLEDGLVSEEDVLAYNAPETPDSKLKANYDNYFAKEETFFNKAHKNFKEKINTDSKLQERYSEFIKNPSYSQWVEKKATTAALIENLYGKNNFLKWDDSKKQNSACTLELKPELDKKLFLALNDENHPLHADAETRWGDIKKDPECQKSMEKYTFKQFLAYDQSKKMYEKVLKANDIKEIADVPIGSSLLDAHVFPEAFDVDFDAKNSRGYSTLHCPMDGGDDDWGLPALKHVESKNQADPKAIEYTGLKYENALETADSARIDGAWQLRLQYAGKGNGEAPKWQEMGEGVIERIKKAFDNKGKQDNIKNIVAENQGGGERISKTQAVLDRLGFPTIEINKDDCTRKNILSLGIHDHESVAKKIQGRENQIDAFTKLCRGIFNFGNNGTSQTQVTALDLVGRKETINDPNWTNNVNKKAVNTPDQAEMKRKEIKNGSNWKVRDPENFEELMFRNLAGDNESKEKLGLNTYKALNRSFYWKNMIETKDNKIINKSGISDVPIVAELLQHFENVVEEKGVYTTAEADKQSDKLMEGLHKKFGKEAVQILLDGHKSLANKPISHKEDKYKRVMMDFAAAVEKYRAGEPAKQVGNAVGNIAGGSVSKEITKDAGKTINHNKQIGFAAAAALLALGGLAQAYKTKTRPNHKSAVAKESHILAKTEHRVAKEMKGVKSNITGASNKKAVSHIA
jgi:hypothetical protein